MSRVRTWFRRALLGAADGLGFGGGAGLAAGRCGAPWGGPGWAATGEGEEKGRVRADDGLASGGGVARAVRSGGSVSRLGKAAAMQSSAAQATRNECSLMPARVGHKARQEEEKST